MLGVLCEGGQAAPCLGPLNFKDKLLVTRRGFPAPEPGACRQSPYPAEDRKEKWEIWGERDCQRHSHGGKGTQPEASASQSRSAARGGGTGRTFCVFPSIVSSQTGNTSLWGQKAEGEPGMLHMLTWGCSHVQEFMELHT